MIVNKMLAMMVLETVTLLNRTFSNVFVMNWVRTPQVGGKLKKRWKTDDSFPTDMTKRVNRLVVFRHIKPTSLSDNTLNWVHPNKIQWMSKNINILREQREWCYPNCFFLSQTMPFNIAVTLTDSYWSELEYFRR